MLLAHKIALDATAAQRRYFAPAAGTARFAWNWALAEWRGQYKAGGKPSEVSLRRELNQLKREQFPWMYAVTKAAVQEAIIDLGRAYRAFFEKRAKFPRFKRKHDRPSLMAMSPQSGVAGFGARRNHQSFQSALHNRRLIATEPAS